MATENSKTEKDLIQELITKSEEEFEKKITFIGAGALILSLTLLEKLFRLENSSGTLFIVLSWGLLIFSLLINFISHLIAKINLRKAEDEIDNKVDFVIRTKNHKTRLKIMESLNWTSAIALILGIIMILVFATINTFNGHASKETIQQRDTLKIEIVNQNYPAYENCKK